MTNESGFNTGHEHRDQSGSAGSGCDKVATTGKGSHPRASNAGPCRLPACDAQAGGVNQPCWQALRDSEQRFNQMAEFIQEVFWMIDPLQDRVLYVNPAFEKVFGIPCHDVQADISVWGSVVYTGDKPVFLHARDQLQQGHTSNIEYRIIRPDRSMRWIRQRAFPIRDSHDRVYRIVGISEDITARKGAESALQAAHQALEQRVTQRTSELQEANRQLQEEIAERRRAQEALAQRTRQLETLANNAPDSICRQDRDGTFVFVNEQLALLTGRPVDAFIGRTAEQAGLDEQLVAFFSSTVSHVCATGNPAEMEFSLTLPAQPVYSASKLRQPARIHFHERNRTTAMRLHRDDSVRYFHSRVVPERNHEGAIETVLSIVRDITASKQTEHALRDSEARHRAIIDAFDGFIYICRSDYRISYMNQPLIERTGYNATGELCYKALHDLDEPCPWCVNDRVFAGETVRWELQSPRDNRWYQITNTPIFHADGSVSKQSMMQDITERKQAEQLVRQREQELARVSRLSVTGEMAAGLAHELNQPLAAIVSYAQTCTHLMDDPEKNLEEIVDILDRIAAQGQRTGSIINRIRRLARDHEPIEVVVDLNELVRELMHLVEMETRKRSIEIHLSLSPTPALVLADPIQLQQVILNLVQNACDAMEQTPPHNRTITIRTFERQDDMCQLDVSDTGKGIPDEHLEQIFEPFFTTKSKGLGFGLAISQTIITTHNGKIWASPNSLRGTTFSFAVPKAEGGETALL